MNYMKNKRGLSPVITTVLLIAIVMVLAVTILMWAWRFVPESVTKNGKNIESVCQEVAFEATYRDLAGGSADQVLVSNNGNVDIYAFEVKLERPGETITQETNPIELKGGASTNITVDIVSSDITKIILTPMLLGEVGEKTEPYLCKNHPGEQIPI